LVPEKSYSNTIAEVSHQTEFKCIFILLFKLYCVPKEQITAAPPPSTLYLLLKLVPDPVRGIQNTAF
jgi:hypothetical protein